MSIQQDLENEKELLLNPVTLIPDFNKDWSSLKIDEDSIMAKTRLGAIGLFSKLENDLIGRCFGGEDFLIANRYKVECHNYEYKKVYVFENTPIFEIFYPTLDKDSERLVINYKIFKELDK